jgi:hypothetical protein
MKRFFKFVFERTLFFIQALTDGWNQFMRLEGLLQKPMFKLSVQGASFGYGIIMRRGDPGVAP